MLSVYQRGWSVPAKCRRPEPWSPWCLCWHRRWWPGSRCTGPLRCRLPLTRPAGRRRPEKSSTAGVRGSASRLHLKLFPALTGSRDGQPRPRVVGDNSSALPHTPFSSVEEDLSQCAAEGVSCDFPKKPLNPIQTTPIPSVGCSWDPSVMAFTWCCPTPLKNPKRFGFDLRLSHPSD